MTVGFPLTATSPGRRSTDGCRGSVESAVDRRGRPLAAPAGRAGLRMVKTASTPPATHSAPEMSDAVWNPAENTSCAGRRRR